MKLLLAALLMSSGLLLAGCATSTNTPTCQLDAQGKCHVHLLAGNRFSPLEVTVSLNTTVVWHNDVATPHNVHATSPANAFNSENMEMAATFEHRFTTKGTFTYECTYHSGMTGTVTVA